MTLLEKLKQRARYLKAESFALYLAARDPRTPWYVKFLVGGIVAYAYSPIDLIPDFVPVLGYLDDLILIPLCGNRCNLASAGGGLYRMDLRGLSAAMIRSAPEI